MHNLTMVKIPIFATLGPEERPVGRPERLYFLTVHPATHQHGLLPIGKSYRIASVVEERPIVDLECGSAQPSLFTLYYLLASPVLHDIV